MAGNSPSSVLLGAQGVAGSHRDGDHDMHAIDLTRNETASPLERRIDLVLRVGVIALALLWLFQG